MKSIFSTIYLLIAVSISALAQKKTGVDSAQCDFLGPLHFKNGKAVVTIKATYNDFHEAAPIYAEKGFRKLRTLLGTRIYSGSDISFTPSGCSKRFDEPFTYPHSCCSDIKIGSVVNLTCIVFENYRAYDYKYFFVVSDMIAVKEK